MKNKHRMIKQMIKLYKECGYTDDTIKELLKSRPITKEEIIKIRKQISFEDEAQRDVGVYHSKKPFCIWDYWYLTPIVVFILFLTLVWVLEHMGIIT